MLKEIRFHGRGGQGIVTAAELLALAAFYENKYAQSFPFFGPERRGAPVISYVRIDDDPVRVRMGIYTPDCVVVLDPQLPRIINVMEGLKDGGIAVLNAKGNPLEIGLAGNRGKVASVDATGIALEIIGKPITNMVMLGAFSAATGLVRIASVLKAIENRFPSAIADKNMKAASFAYENTQVYEVG